MKKNRQRHAPPTTPAASAFALHPLTLAALVALAGPAAALPTGGSVVGGQATIQAPSATQQVVTQSSQKAVIDWTTFSIGAGETVRFDQPSSSAVLLNRVTGHDPSAIFGQMQSNGRIFLLNPYGVVFGASARVDVGGLVASSLSLSTADFMAGRFGLGGSGDPNAPAQRGEVRNDGSIRAPGGSVVLLAPRVTNNGTIEAAGGRVGLAAAQEALVDVEGDGLIFFRTSGTEAGNRLAQLGRIQADGGSVELRAAARGAFADTVLNMGGVVQARSIGVKQGRVVIDGGEAGITHVAGQVDASGSGSGERGGQVSVRGQKVLLDLEAVLNASGHAGGGKVTVGGDWQGQGADASAGRNAEMTHVASGARIDVAATAQGDGGTAVVWADGSTRFHGAIDARAGANGGDGGQVEVSGKAQLAFAGAVTTTAAQGRAGRLLLDPTDITIAAGGANETTTSAAPAPFTIEGNQAASNLPVGTLTTLLNTNGSVTVDATAGTGGAGSISIETPIAWNSANSLTLLATTTISSTDTSPISNGGTGNLTLTAGTGVTLRAPVTLAGGSFTATSATGNILIDTTITTSGAAAAPNTGSILNRAGGRAGDVTVQALGAGGTVDIRGAITAVGGSGGDGLGAGDSGGTGGGGGNVLVSTVGGTVATRGIVTHGGAGGAGIAGSDPGNNNGGSGGSGGNAGTIQVTAAGTGNDATIGGALSAIGGVGRDGAAGNGGSANGGDGGKGGNGGTVTLGAGARVVLGANTIDSGGATGGAAGAAGGGGGNAGAVLGPGTNAGITITAGTDFTVTSALDATGGTGAATVSLTVGAAGGGGALDLGTPGLISAGALSVAGGGGSDTIVATLVGTGGFVRSGATPAVLSLNGQSGSIASIENAQVTGSSSDNTIDVSGFSGTATIALSGGADSITGTGANSRTTLIGRDLASTFAIANGNAGSVTAGGATTTFTGVGNLSGGSANDAFDFTAAAGALTGSIDGGGSTGGAGNTLGLAGLGAGTTITIDQQAATATGIGGTFASIGTVTGNGANTTLAGTTAGQAYTVTGSNSGTAGSLGFVDVASLTGGNGSDSFAFTTPASRLTGTLAGGGGTNTLNLAGLGAAKTVSIDQQAATITDTAGPTTLVGSFSGIASVNGNGANTTIVGASAGQSFAIGGADQGTADTLAFTNVGSLRSGGGANAFVFGEGGSLSGSLAGGAGADTLDLSAKSGAVAVNQQAGTATGVGGTIAAIDVLVGNGSNTTLTGANAGQTFAVTLPGQGTAGALAFSGVTSLVGGSGADTFTFSGTGALTGSLSDSGGTSTLNGAIATGGAQNYTGAVTLGSTVALSSSGNQAIAIGGAVDGPHALTITSAGTKTLGGPVGGGTALSSLSIAGGGTTSITGGAVTTSGAQSYASAVDATTLALTTTGAAGDITAANAANDFGTVTLQTVNGASVTLVDANSLVLGNVALGTGTHAITAGPAAPGTGATLTRGGSFSAGSTPTLTVGGIAVDGSVQNYFATGAATTIAIQKGSGSTHHVDATGASVLPTLSVSGNLSVAGNAAITQTGPLSVTGTASVAAGANPITLTDANNDFVGALSLTGAAVQVTDANALQLGSVNAASLVLNTSGAVTQNADLAIAGTTAVQAGSGDITLTRNTNDFGGTVTLAGGAIGVRDANALAVAGLTSAGNAGVDLRALGGALTLPAQALNTGTGDLTLVGSGGIGQGAGSTLLSSGTTTIDGGTQAVALTQANALSGTINLRGGTTQLTNTVGTTVVLDTTGATTLSAAGQTLAVSGTTTGALGLTAASATVNHTGALTLGAASIAGSLGVTTNGAALTQSGALAVGGATNLDAGGAAITLAHAGNDFGGTVTVGGGTVSLADANGLSVAGTATGALSLAGTNVTVNHTGALNLGPATVTGNLVVTTGSAAVAQSGALSVAGTANVNAGSGNVTLAHGSNDFGGVLTVSGGAIAVSDANNLSVAATPGANQALSLSAGGSLTLLNGGAIDTGSADLALASGAGLSTAAALRGANVTLNGGAGGMTLNDDVTASGSLALNATNAAITQAAGRIAATGAATVNAGTGAITLSSATNDFQSAVSLTGGAVQMRDANALTLGASNVGSLAVTANGSVAQSGTLSVAGTTTIAAGAGDVALGLSANNFVGQVTASGGAIQIADANDLNVVASPGANRSLSLVALGALTVPGGTIDTGTADLTLSSGTGLATTGSLRGTHLTLSGGTGGITLNNDVVAAGTLSLGTSGAAITQTAGRIAVGSTTQANAGAAAITLGNASNDFGGTVTITGTAVTLADANALSVVGTATGALSLNGSDVTLSHTGALTLGPGAVSGNLGVTTNNAAVSQSGALNVAGTASVQAGSADITLTNASNTLGGFAATGGAVSVVDASGGLVLGAISAGSLGIDTAAGSGPVTQTAAVQVGGATTIAAGTGNVTLTNAGNDFGTLALAGGAISVVDASALTVTSLASGANQAVSLRAAGDLVLPAAAVNAGTADLTLASTSGVLDVNGALAGRAVALAGGAGITLGGNVTSSADQTYTGALALTTDAALNAGGGRIALQGPVDGGGRDLVLTSSNGAADAIRTGASVANVGVFTAAGHTTLGGGVASAGDQTFGGTLTLGADAALNAGAGRLALQGAVDAGGHALALASSNAAADAIRLGAAVANAGTFTAAGRTTLGGNVASSGDQAYGATLTLTADAALNAGAGRIAVQGAVDGGGHALTLASTHGAADAIRTGATVANVAGFSALGRTTLGGGVTSTGDQTYDATLALAADAALNAGAGRIALAGAVDGGGHDLALTSSHAAVDAIRTGAGVGNVGDFSANGNLSLGGSVASAGRQTYAGPVLLTTATTLSGTDLDLLGSVDGSQALTLAGSGTTTLAGTIGGNQALASITDGGGGTTRIGTSVTTTGAQQWGDALVLTAATTLTGTTLHFGGPINGAQSLAVSGSASTAVFDGAVGGTAALASLAVTGPTVLNGGSVRTTGSQTYGGALTLGADTVLAGNGIAVAGAIDGARALTVQNAGTTSVGGAIGATTALGSLDVDDGGPTVLTGGLVRTSGAQAYSGPVQLGGTATRFDASALSFGAGASGAANLTLDTDTLTLAGTVSGTGVLTIAPRSPDRSIGLAGAPGGLQVSQALLSGASGFSAHVIGRADGSGDIASNALQLGADTTLQTGSGNLSLNGSVDGAFALALNSGGTTRIGGPVGTTTALRSLSTDNQAGAADWNGSAGEHTRVDAIDASGRARLVTTGAQVFADPLVVTVPVQFVGSAVAATQPASRFDGTVHANAGTLDLRSGRAIVLGDVTLANGGRIETDGTLELTGALVLNGGTLSLVTNATPTSIGFTDPDLQGRTLSFQLAPVSEASATLFQSGSATLSSASGSLLVLRSPNGGSLSLENAGNDLRGGISAVSGTLGDTSSTRFSNQPLGFVRIVSTEINAAGAPPTDGSQALLQAGIEGDVLKLSADKLTTGPTGQLRARLPFDNTQGSSTSVPGMTLIMSPTALTIGGGFGLSTPDGYIRVRIGSELGGFLTVRPRGASGENAFILLSGPDPKPFYDLSGKLTEVRVFYNGDAPRTPQESGALTAVLAIVEDARQTRFEEAVRTENVKSRLRSGVIAEVGAGRPATVGRESIRLPSSCNPKETTLQCE